MKTIWFTVVLCILSVFVFAQARDDDESEYDENYEFPETKELNINIGLGLGMDYGGIGAKLMITPAKSVGIFGSIGYNLNGAGYNGGIIFRMLPEKKVCPYLSAMYGYNAVIIVEGLKQANKTYFGPSFSGGIELRLANRNFWNFGLLVPIRSTEFRDDFDALDNNPYIDITEPLPIAITVGYHFAL